MMNTHDDESRITDVALRVSSSTCTWEYSLDRDSGSASIAEACTRPVAVACAAGVLRRSGRCTHDKVTGLL